MTSQLAMELPPLPSSPGMGRRALTAWLGRADLVDPDGVAVLMLSELITNAVLHGREPISLRAMCTDGTIRVEVFDGSPTLATLGPAITGSERGRGLNIVDALATRWGSEPAPGGKITWFESTTKPSGWSDD